MHKPKNTTCGNKIDDEEIQIRRGLTMSVSPVIRLYWELRALLYRATQRDSLSKQQMSNAISDVVTDLELKL